MIFRIEKTQPIQPELPKKGDLEFSKKTKRKQALIETGDNVEISEEAMRRHKEQIH